MADDPDTKPSDGATPAAKWLEMLKEAEDADRSYHARCDNIDKLYADLDAMSKNGERQYQMFWANIQTLKPAVYTKPPVPVVSSRFRDRKPLPRKAADILERALISDIEADELHETLLLIRDDLAINARGAGRVRIDTRDGIEVPVAEHIDRKDFRHEPARKWKEVGWVAFRGWLSRREVVERFERVPEGMNFEKRPIGDWKGSRKAGVWEIWHRAENKVVFVSEGVEELLDEQKPWLSLTGFFPCPKPAFGTTEQRSLTPVPDFVFYKDQLEEINDLTARVSALTDSLRLKGFYAGGNADAGEAFETAMKSMDDKAVLVPVSSLAALGPSGIKDMVLWMPIAEVASVIEQCLVLRRQLIEDVYQITGLSDIMRGATDANETATAQQLKSQYGSVRVRDRQQEVVRFARDIIRIKAEIMAEKVSIEDLLVMAQVDDLPRQADIQAQVQQIIQQTKAQLEPMVQQGMQMQQQGQDPSELQKQGEQIQQQAQQQVQELQSQVTVEAVGQLLKDQKTRPFVLDVETDSTVEADQMMEKQTRVEFTQALGPMLQQAVQAMQLAPQLGAFVAESIRYMASGFKVDRRMDEAVDELAEQLANYQPPPGGEDPEAAKMMAQAEQQKAQAAGQLAQAKAQEAMGKVEVMKAEAGISQQQAQVDAQKTGVEIEKLKAEIQKIGVEMQVKQQQAAVDMAVSEQNAALTERQSEADMARADEQHALTTEKTQADMRRADDQAKVGAEKTKADIKRQDFIAKQPKGPK